MGHSLHLTVDGQEHTLVVDSRTTLLDALRDRLGVMSAKKGCDHGQCGACTVLVDGRRLNSCLALALTQHGAEVMTADGLAPEGELFHCIRAFRPRRISVRILHTGPGVFGRRHAGRSRRQRTERGHRRSRRARGAVRGGDPRANERQPLSLRSLRQHRRGREPSRRGVTMNPFDYERAADAAGAVTTVTDRPDAVFLAGGTNLVDHLKLGVAEPGLVVDINRLELTGESRQLTTGACGSVRWCATAMPPPIRASAATTRCSHAPCSPAPPVSCATRPRWAATCRSRTRCVYSRHDDPATNANPAPVASHRRPAPATHARSSVPQRTVWRRIPRIWRSL